MLLGFVWRGIIWAVGLWSAGALLILVLDALRSAAGVAVALPLGLCLMLSVLAAMVVDVFRVPVDDVQLPSWKSAWAYLVARDVRSLGLTVFFVAMLLWGSVVAFAAALRERYVQAFTIPDGSMMPTLLVGDRVLVNRFVYRFRDPQRGDVIVFTYPVLVHRDSIGRVVGIGGDELYVKDRHVYVNCRPPAPTCQPIAEPWAFYEERPTAGADAFGPVRVPSGSYFVMGDNRNDSQDSRTWGFVKREKVKGPAFAIYWSWDPQHDVRWNRLGRLADS